MVDALQCVTHFGPALVGGDPERVVDMAAAERFGKQVVAGNVEICENFRNIVFDHFSLCPLRLKQAGRIFAGCDEFFNALFDFFPVRTISDAEP